ncbi:hypothetical protein KFE19_01545 [Dysosmobacter sp. Marseille-Q4140]|nr:hypothetical protein KFE19_01545 [Dysosmobacter sp. Marseille-Q4140]
MRDTIDRVALRYLAAVLLGLVLLLLHGTVRSGPAAVLVPQRASPWELSKLVFWPMLGVCFLTCRLGRAPGPVVRDLPAAVLASLGAVALNGAILAAGGSGRLCLAVWAGALAAGIAFGPDGARRPRIWLVLCGLLAACYVLLTFLVPPWGLFQGLAAG